MIYFKKSQPAPNCLEEEKSKKSGKYDCGCVLERLKNDFKNKCYICESKAPTGINVEHFKSHQGDVDLKFDWNNLFFVCTHCNNTKLAQFDDILNCTDFNDDIENALKYEIKLFPHEPVKIETLNNDARTETTKELLLAVFNGTTTKNKILESSNLRNELLKEMKNYQNYLCEYYDDTLDEDNKNRVLRNIKSHLNSASAFTAFKRQVIKDNNMLSADFSCFISRQK